MRSIFIGQVTSVSFEEARRPVYRLPGPARGLFYRIQCSKAGLIPQRPQASAPRGHTRYPPSALATRSRIQPPTACPTAKLPSRNNKRNIVSAPASLVHRHPVAHQTDEQCLH